MPTEVLANSDTSLGISFLATSCESFLFEMPKFVAGVAIEPNENGADVAILELTATAVFVVEIGDDVSFTLDGIVEDTICVDVTLGKVENGFVVELIFILPEEKSDVPEFT